MAINLSFESAAEKKAREKQTEFRRKRLIEDAKPLIHVLRGLERLGQRRKHGRFTVDLKRVSDDEGAAKVLDPAAYVYGIDYQDRTGRVIGGGVALMIEPDDEGYVDKITVMRNDAEGKPQPIVYTDMRDAIEDVMDWARHMRPLSRRVERSLTR